MAGSPLQALKLAQEAWESEKSRFKAMVRQFQHFIVLEPFYTSQLCIIPRAPCAILYLVPIVIGC